MTGKNSRARGQPISLLPNLRFLQGTVTLAVPILGWGSTSLDSTLHCVPHLVGSHVFFTVTARQGDRKAKQQEATK